MSVVVTAAGQSTMDDSTGRSRALGGDARTLVLRSPCSERTHQEDSKRLPNRARGGGAVGTATSRHHAVLEAVGDADGRARSPH
ncbi:hypothetical protein C486_16318 [Natrinema gari JCM 14663]|uniref:Uncharacterized protein n=1 Tax=Natrinema gari JCM 14663 TaxID=1230459 RepID=L9YUI6_9EURY|nr:hypothetical protein C486_16318 [Natrinema gari JCM 14663]